MPGRGDGIDVHPGCSTVVFATLLPIILNLDRKLLIAESRLPESKQTDFPLFGAIIF